MRPAVLATMGIGGPRLLLVLGLAGCDKAPDEGEGPDLVEPGGALGGCTADGTVDDLDDGVVDQLIHWEYSEHGWLVLQEERTADGALVYRSALVRDADGNTLEEEADLDGDGTVDYRLVQEFDADGNLVWFEEDEGGDGEVDLRGTYEVSGGLVRTGRLAYRDNTRDLDLAYTYDDLDRLVEVQAAEVRSGQLQQVDHYTWHLDTDLLASHDLDMVFLDGEGPPYITGSAYDYDDELRVVGLLSYDRLGALHESESVYHYDALAPDGAWADGELTHRTDGVVDGAGSVERAYDPDWRPTLWVIDGDGPYTPVRQVVEWTCP